MTNAGILDIMHSRNRDHQKALCIQRTPHEPEGRDTVQKGEKKRTFLKELLRYFGFPLAAAGVMVLAFFLLQGQIVKEIRKGTYEILIDAARQQSITLERYVDLLATRVYLIADYDADTGPNTLVESLRTELHDEAVDVEIGYANSMGYLLYSDQRQRNVGSEEWFRKSLSGETLVTTGTQNEDDGLVDVRVSANVNTRTGVHGVLFTTLSNRNFSGLFNTLAYESAADTFVCDATGTILFVEQSMEFVRAGERIRRYINDESLDNGVSFDQLKDQIKQDQIVTFRFQSTDKAYYGACEWLSAYDWYVFTLVPGDVADVISNRVSAYQMTMLIIILLTGVSMAAQSYRHERQTVKKLEADKELLLQSAQRYQLITQLSNEVLFHISLDDGIISFNDSFEAMFGFPPPVCTVDSLNECTDLFYEEDQVLFLSLVNQLRAGDTEARAELRMVNSRGVARWKRVEIFAVVDQDKNAVQLVGKIADIHRQKKNIQRLIRQADSDPLTGLLNRAAMERNIKAFLVGEGLGGRHALMMLDFDNFKAVNDTLGHARGDQLLVSFANGIRRLFRSGDYLSRIGGDEYMLFIKNTGEDIVAQDKAEALREEMAGLSRKLGVPVSISVGIAVYERDGDSFEKLYRAADEALYHVKRNGKNAISFFSVPLFAGEEESLEHPDEGDELCDIDGMCDNKPDEE
jgi:diguanylate cyclase (GGDEF)-like protein/PAS domain S-box-containing protein